MKRDRKFIFCMTDAEYELLERLAVTYSGDIDRPNKAHALRVAMKSLPVQQVLPLTNVSI